MKIFRFCFWLLVVNLAYPQQRLPFDESGFKAVLAKGKAEQKPVFYMLHAEWCPHCQKMKAQVFTDPKVIDFLTKNFVCGWQDIEVGEGPALRQKLQTKLFPYFVFISPQGKIVYAVSGELTSEELIREATAALDPARQFPYLEQQFLADTSNPQKCLALLTALRKGYDRTFLNPSAHTYFQTVPDDKMVSEINWSIFANGVTDIESREFQYVLKHQKEFAAVSSSERVERKILNAVTEMMSAFAYGTDTVNYRIKRHIAKSIGLHKTDSLVFRYDLEMTERTNDKKGYGEATAVNVRRFAWNSASLLRSVANNYAAFYADAKSLELALGWIRRAFELEKTVDARLTEARILHKMGKRAEAIEAARNARSLALSYGFSTQPADLLLAEYEKP